MRTFLSASLLLAILGFCSGRSDERAPPLDAFDAPYHAPYQPLDSRNVEVVRRNFLRFGKRADENEPHQRQSRDYREFVRFGKRDFESAGGSLALQTPLQRPVARSFLRYGRKDDYLRFGKREDYDNEDEHLEDKRSTDYLRFGR